MPGFCCSLGEGLDLGAQAPGFQPQVREGEAQKPGYSGEWWGLKVGAGMPGISSSPAEEGGRVHCTSLPPACSPSPCCRGCAIALPCMWCTPILLNVGWWGYTAFPASLPTLLVCASYCMFHEGGWDREWV